jgi:hypothetical protein
VPKLSDVCHQVRSKNAGPFWITVDLFFRDADSFARFGDHELLQAHSIAEIFGVDAAAIKRFRVPGLLVLKISYPRPVPQGGIWERDMHGGQQYVRLLDLLMEPSIARHPSELGAAQHHIRPV